MTFTGHTHPLLVHFPIGLILMSAAAEALAILTRGERWRVAAVANVRAGAVFAAAAVASGWLLAVSTVVLYPSSLLWHRWIGTGAALLTVGAALATGEAARRSAAGRWMYRIALFGAAGLVAVAGHLGGLLVWGADFLRQ
jgi:uncharacterized membrane protein